MVWGSTRQGGFPCTAALKYLQASTIPVPQQRWDPSRAGCTPRRGRGHAETLGGMTPPAAVFRGAPGGREGGRGSLSHQGRESALFGGSAETGQQDHTGHTGVTPTPRMASGLRA